MITPKLIINTYVSLMYELKKKVGKVLTNKSVGTRYGLDGPGIESRWGERPSAPVQIGPWAHPASYAVGTWSFPEVKRPGRGVNHPPHLTPRLKKK